MIYTPDVPSKLACIFNEPDALHLLLDCELRSPLSQSRRTMCALKPRYYSGSF
jgi:hypothetical protein